MKVVNLLVVIITGMVLAYGTMDMPDWGDPNSPANSHVSPQYISDAVEKTATPNIVTAVLADYRGYDTLGEPAVIFSAGMACIFLLRRKRKK
ncbi:MAG: hypothetical protein QNK40_01595 [Desulfobacterales bacterium]|nr:hypothetical protein [Desulfobacterales bacterium]MDX2508149.1 hypothetical protein [Desulfobacterales bacterium]